MAGAMLYYVEREKIAGIVGIVLCFGLICEALKRFRVVMRCLSESERRGVGEEAGLFK
jgi:hypothetical protein